MSDYQFLNIAPNSVYQISLLHAYSVNAISSYITNRTNL